MGAKEIGMVGRENRKWSGSRERKLMEGEGTIQAGRGGTPCGAGMSRLEK